MNAIEAEEKRVVLVSVMARLSVAVALFLCIWSPQPCLAQETADDQVTGEARDDLPRVLREMCYQSYNRYFARIWNKKSLAPSWLSEILQHEISQRVDQYFYERPVHTPRNSICAPMNTTCCMPRTEKHIARMTIKEYGELFLNVTHENVGSCFTVGRHFYHAMYSNFLEIRRQLEIPVKNLLDNKMPEDLFKDFFQYLSSLSVVSDLCDLPLELTAVMSKIFDFVYNAQPGESLRETHTTCYQNVSAQLMSETYERLFNGLERQLYNLDLVFRAMQISETVLERLKRHRFATECTKPLTQMFNCAQCTGYFLFKPCLFYCMNVLRGCFADIADVHKDFQLMTKALSDIPDDILGTFQPEVFIKDSLTHFVNLVQDLRALDLKSEIYTACTGENSAVKRKRSGYSRRQSSAFTTVSPSASSQEEGRLAAAFDMELRCMEKIGSLLGNVPEEMCYQSKEHPTIADTGNHQCWLGSSFGTYYHSQVKFTKEEQANNPEFRHSAHPPYLNQFTDLCMELSMITAELNETLDLVLCLDDEDCTTAPFYICGGEEDDVVSGSGSGSGEGELEGMVSGRGSGSGLSSGGSADDGLHDMEDGDSEIGVVESTLESFDTPTPYSAPRNTTEPEETPGVEKEDRYTVYDIISDPNTTSDSTPSSDMPPITESGDDKPSVTESILEDKPSLPEDKPVLPEDKPVLPEDKPSSPEVGIISVGIDKVDGTTDQPTLTSLALELKSSNFIFLSAVAVFLLT
jgi:hypothetical protein